MADVKMEGPLKKLKKSKLKKSHVRYFVLRGSVLQYFEGQGGHAIDALDISDSKVADGPTPNSFHLFQVSGAKKKKKNGKITLEADTPILKAAWVDALGRPVMSTVETTTALQAMAAVDDPVDAPPPD
eukprot:TRINITY_DN22958_c0_g1_i1.p1 TRINITY_DN22958_c0_g1~~TRINITY_DN22958_c0_g1_i1.p1  ORF type:complete len:128 (+),score=23.38 TRINITY_DN22958_c0_g1_i1:74-457(+)